MAMRDYFKGAVSALAGVGMLAGAAFPDAASAQDQQMAANDTARPQAASLLTAPPKPTKGHVILRVRPELTSAADGIAGYVEQMGNCTAEVTGVKGLPGRVGVEVGKKNFRFKSDELGSAASTALEWCLEQSPS